MKKKRLKTPIKNNTNFSARTEAMNRQEIYKNLSFPIKRKIRDVVNLLVRELCKCTQHFLEDVQLDADYNILSTITPG